LTRLPVLITCLILSSALAAQTQSPGHRPTLAQEATVDSEKLLGDRPASELQDEWWQLTASLTDRDGRPWMLEWTLHRQQSGSRAAGNKLPADSMSLAHVSITTPDGIYHEQNFVNNDVAAIGAAESSGKSGLAGWEWVSQGQALLPARLSFSVGERDVNLLLQAPEAGDQAAAASANHAASLPAVRVRGFVDRGASKTYLRGIGRLDRETRSAAVVGKPVDINQSTVRKISSASE